jgi:putative restriction endonuclease
MATGRAWTERELVVSMNLYCTLPFGKFDQRNPTVIEIAKLLERTPSSLSMKLCNIASLDPFHAARGVRGLKAASQADRAIWKKFHEDWEGSALESEEAIARLRNQSLAQHANIDESLLPREGLEKTRFVKQRVNQYFFRSTILATYKQRCCVTGIASPELVVASHIIPWSKNKETRMNPRNGLCLNALHDRAFDCGLMTLTTDFRVKLSPRFRLEEPTPTKKWLNDFEGRKIQLPERFQPDQDFLQWHRENVFLTD